MQEKATYIGRLKVESKFDHMNITWPLSEKHMCLEYPCTYVDRRENAIRLFSSPINAEPGSKAVHQYPQKTKVEGFFLDDGNGCITGQVLFWQVAHSMHIKCLSFEQIARVRPLPKEICPAMHPPF